MIYHLTQDKGLTQIYGFNNHLLFGYLVFYLACIGKLALILIIYNQL